MAEVLTYAEGTAQAWTGAASPTTMLYVRGVTVSPSYIWYKGKPPHATTYTNYPIGSAASLTVSQARAHRDVVKMFQGATGGGFHFHAFQSAATISESAGIYLYSGNLISMSITEQEGQEVMLSFAAEFPTWTAY